jgi:hypothetical protein
MRRPLALSLIVLGLVVTLIGGTGLFAPFTDRASTGVNSVTSGERPKAADLKLAITDGGTDCATATYSDNITTPGISAANAQPGFKDLIYFCLKNAGSAELGVSLKVIDVANVDIDCTADEAVVDTTCGADGAGELGSVLHNYAVLVCPGGTASTYVGGFLSDSPTTYLSLLPAGAIWCGSIETFYPLNRSVDEVLRAQSDKVTWKYAFDGTT